MRKIYSKLAYLVLFCAFFVTQLSAQTNNLKVAFKDAASAPRNLNVCGDEATVTMSVSTDGLLSTARRNIAATLKLFKGVQFVRFNAAGTSAGVSMTTSSAGGAVFALPDLIPASSTSFVNISYVIRVNCAYTDTLTVNDLIDVRDQWSFRYDMAPSVGLTETDLSTPYRDQIKVPFFTMAVTNNVVAARVGLCFQRKILINNSGLDGYVKSFEYKNTQGPGIYVQSVTINGQTVAVTKTPTFGFSGDTIITATVPAALFAFNTRGPSTPADGDLLFEPDETVTVIENFCVTSCTKSRTSTHAMSWGCDTRLCNTISRQDIIRLGEGQVNVGFSPQGLLPAIVGGYCKEGRSTVTFTNNGVEVDPGTAGMYDLQLGVGLGDSILLSDKGYRITKVIIAGKTMPASAIALADLRNNALFAADPDGANVGLGDLDGDGFFDDLPLGKSVEITVFYEVDCNASLSNRFNKCKNDFETAFNAQLNYTDLCGRRNQIIKPRYFAPLNVNDLIENCSDPDCKTDEKPFSIQHLERRNIFNFERNCNGQEEILVKIKVPTGINPIKDSMYLLRFTDTLFLKTMRTSGDTVYLAFRADSAKQKGSRPGQMIPVDFINGDYKVNFSFKATCQAAPGWSNFPMEMAFSCPPCACQHVWYCDTLAGPRVHYAEPPCAPNAAYECPKGLKTSIFTVNRTTLGYTDQTYRTKIAPSKANLKVAMACDSVRMTVLNVVGNAPISDSIGVRISYNNITNLAQTRLNDIFQYGKGVVRFVKNGQVYTCPVEPAQVRVVRSDSSKFVYVDLHTCLTSLNIGPLSKGDSVNFYGDFGVFTDGPYKNTFEKIPQFRAYGYHIDGGQEFACDNFGETYRVGKSQSIFSYPTSSSYPKGCAETNLDYKIIMVNNGYYDHWGIEYRQSVGVDSFTLQFDPEFLRAFSTKVEVNIPDHPFAGNNFYPLSNLDSTGKYVARFDSLRIVPSLNRVSSYAFNLRIKVTPNCRSLTGSALNNSTFAFRPKMFYRDRYYAVEIGDGACAPYRRDSVPSGTIVYSDPPALTFVPVSNPTVATATDTVQWTVKQCNTSNKGGAGTTWVSVEPTPSVQNFRVVKMRDITNNLNQLNLAFSTYGTGGRNAFAYTNPLTIATPDKTLDDICNVVEITAVSGDCGDSKIDINSGWNCIKPTDPLWNPTQYLPCTDLTIQATLTKEAPFLDANFINQSLNKPGICDSTVFEILLRNTDLGKVFDVRTRIVLPLLGATYIPSRVEVAYPSSAPYHLATGVPSVVGLTERGRVFQYADFSKLDTFLHRNGLKGFDPSRPNDSNEVKIRFRFSNDCDFKSGSLLYYSFIGKTSCGTPSNNETGESLPIHIAGAELTAPKLYTVGTNVTNHFVPGAESTIEVDFTNKTTTLSDAADEISVKLPAGIEYKANSATSVQPSTWVPGEPRIKLVGDIQIVTWYQPRGLVLNEKAILRFKVTTPNTLSCDGGTRAIGVTTMTEKELVCNTSQNTCSVEVITTSGGEQYYDVPLSPDTLNITSTPLITSGVIRARRGETVVLTATGASVRWIDTRDNSVLGTNITLSFQPTRAETIIKVEATSGNCLAPSTVRILTDQDTAAPRITVRDTTVGCRDSFPLIFPIVTDDTDPNPSVTYSDRIEQLQPCGERLIRTWTATDASGKSATATQTITRIDRAPPVITMKNPRLLSLGIRSGDTLTVTCQTIPLFNIFDIDAVDDCDTSLSKSFVDIAARFGRCVEDGFLVVMECEWRVVDKCGNVATFKIFVKVVDNEAPRVMNLPADITVNSLSEVPVRADVFGRDDCDDLVTVEFKERIYGDTLIQRTWILMDDCGHTSTGVQYITIRSSGAARRDTIAPQFQVNNAVLPNSLRSGDTTRYNGCDYSLGKADMRVTDNRDANPRVTLDSTVQNGTCRVDGYLRLKRYTWTATDSSGNVATFKINILISDTVSPILSGVPNNVNLVAGETFPLEPTVTATDNCSTPTVTLAKTETLVGRDTVYTRTWTAVDACGNTSTGQQIIVRSGIGIIQPDTLAPQFQVVDPALAGRRSGDTIKTADCTFFLERNSLTVTDNRDPNPTVRFDTTVVRGVCAVDGYVFLKSYNWSAKDSSGNTSTFKIYLKVSDNTPPQILGIPADVTILANETIPVANVTTTDDCTIATMTMGISVIQNGRDTLFVRAWTATDECGNIAIERQNVYKRGGANNQSNGTIVEVLAKQMIENQSDTLCFKNTILDSTYTVTNICPDSTTGSASFTLIRGNSCVIVKGLAEGISKACFQVCDNTGRCDTTYIRVVIAARQARKPVLKEDVAITRKNKSIVIPVFQNDSVSGVIKSFSIKLQPANGEATARQVGNEYFIVYAPKEDQCSTKAVDKTIYEVCNTVGCDQTMVRVTTLCDGLVIRNGFSPNGDGVNENFVIENLVDFPNTQVSIYNRWGSRVYLNNDYQNNWKGDYQGNLLPTGTYFYRIVLENGEKFTGYLEIQR